MRFLIIGFIFTLLSIPVFAIDKYNGHKDKDVEFAIDDGQSEPELVFIDKDAEAQKEELDRRRKKAFAKKLAKGMNRVLGDIRAKKAALAYQKAQKIRRKKQRERDRLAANNLANQIEAQAQRSLAARSAKPGQVVAALTKSKVQLVKKKSLKDKLAKVTGTSTPVLGMPLGVASLSGKQRLWSALRSRVAKRSGKRPNATRSIASSPTGSKAEMTKAVQKQQNAVLQRSMTARKNQQVKAVASRSKTQLIGHGGVARAPASFKPKSAPKSGFFGSIGNKIKVRYLQIKKAFSSMWK